jgi:hypothetical protein
LPTSSRQLLAFRDLNRLAYFFAMRSCEYLQTEGQEGRRTIPLQLQNITFHRQRVLVPHSDPHLCSSDTVTLTFVTQKNTAHHNSVIQHATQAAHCPVRTAASIIRRLLDISCLPTDFIYHYRGANGQRVALTATFASPTYTHSSTAAHMHPTWASPPPMWDSTRCVPPPWPCT